MKANYHTHLSLCGHAAGMSEDYVKVAIEAGYKELGMSDHGPIKPSFMTPEEFKYNWLERQMTYEEFLNIYLPDCQRVKEKYKDLIKFHIGIEIEYLYPFHKYFEELFYRLFHFFVLHICNLTVLVFFKTVIWEFPGSPVVRTLCRGPRFNPWSGN